MDVALSDGSLEGLVNPIPQAKSTRFTVKVKPLDREVVFVDNGKPNSIKILSVARDELRKRGIAVREEIVVRPLSRDSLSSEGRWVEILSRERGLVLDGIND